MTNDAIRNWMQAGKYTVVEVGLQDHLFGPPQEMVQLNSAGRASIVITREQWRNAQTMRAPRPSDNLNLFFTL